MTKSDLIMGYVSDWMKLLHIPIYMYSSGLFVSTNVITIYTYVGALSTSSLQYIYLLKGKRFFFYLYEVGRLYDFILEFT